MSEPTNKPGRKMDVVSPIGDRVLIRRESQRTTTKAGIHLPDGIKIPTLKGRVLAVSVKVSIDADYADIKTGQRVLFNPSRQIPVDFEQGDNPLFVVPVEDVVAVINQEDADGAENQRAQGRRPTDVE